MEEYIIQSEPLPEGYFSDTPKQKAVIEYNGIEFEIQYFIDTFMNESAPTK